VIFLPEARPANMDEAYSSPHTPEVLPTMMLTPPIGL
jgi:hypothetical protein